MSVNEDMYSKRRPTSTLTAALTTGTRTPLLLALSVVLLLYAASAYLRPVDKAITDVSSSSTLTNPGSIISTSSTNIAWVNMSTASRLRAVARGTWNKIGDSTQYGMSAVSGTASLMLGSIWLLVRPYALGAAGLWLMTLSDTAFALLASVFVFGYTTYTVAPQFILNTLLPFVWEVLWFLLRNPMCIVMLVGLRLAVLLYSTGRSLVAGYTAVATILPWLPGCPTEASAVGSVTQSEFEKFKSEVMHRLDQYERLMKQDLATVKTDS